MLVFGAVEILLLQMLQQRWVSIWLSKVRVPTRYLIYFLLACCL